MLLEALPLRRLEKVEKEDLGGKPNGRCFGGGVGWKWVRLMKGWTVRTTYGRVLPWGDSPAVFVGASHDVGAGVDAGRDVGAGGVVGGGHDVGEWAVGVWDVHGPCGGLRHRM